jgi:CheY-like chemotaxis protein
MGSGDISLDEHTEKSRQEGLDAVGDRIERLTWMLADCREGMVEPDEAIKAIRIDVHGIKGTGNAYGFPVIAIFAHRLEDYLDQVKKLNEGPHLDDVQKFLDCIQDAAEKNLDAGGDEIAVLVRKLPTHAAASFNVEDVVVPAGVAGKMVAQELRECGYRVVSVADPFEAMQFVISAKPDVVIVSAILERLDGVDLVSALKAMPSTRDMPVAFLTSLEEGDERLKFLPASVPVLHKGASFADDVAEAFAALKIT